jgi:hypothetical protein
LASAAARLRWRPSHGGIARSQHVVAVPGIAQDRDSRELTAVAPPVIATAVR